MSYTATPILTLSIVSHGQSALIRHLLDDLRLLGLPDIEVLITVNIPEDEVPFENLPFSSIIIRNLAQQGFGENHNAAFRQSRGKYFVVVNPDIRLPSLDVQLLLSLMDEPNVGCVVPVVLNSNGDIEDSVRRFPTIIKLAQRVVLRQRIPDYCWSNSPIDVDWAAGMFMVFRREAFAMVNGFDSKRFFMYLEDVDICRRLKKTGWRIVLQPALSVVHDAQRASHRSLRHMRWHLISALRYFSGL